MRRLWHVRIGWMIVAVVQAAVLLGAWYVQRLTTERMMVMRYFVAKNRLLEEAWFSPSAMLAHRVLFLTAAVILAALTVRSFRRSRPRSVAAAIGLVLAALGAWLSWALTVADAHGLYLLIAAVWVALALQVGVAAMLGRAGRTV